MNSKNSKNSVKTADTVKLGVGRPRASVRYLRTGGVNSGWTFAQHAVFNGALTEDGKFPETPKVVPLTLRNHLKDSMYLRGEDGEYQRDGKAYRVNPKSVVMVHPTATRKSEGAGRNPIIYILREVYEAALAKAKPAKVAAPKKSKGKSKGKSPVTVSLADAPAPAETAPTEAPAETVATAETVPAA